MFLRDSIDGAGRCCRMVLLTPLRPGQVFFEFLMHCLISSVVMGAVRNGSSFSLLRSACVCGCVLCSLVAKWLVTV